MKRQNVSRLFENKGVKIVGYAFVTVFLGAIGSGFWEKFLSRWYDFISTAILTLLNKVFNGYANLLYARVGDAQSDILAYLPYTLIIFIFSTLPWVLMFLLMSKLKNLSKYNDGDDDSDDNTDDDIAIPEFISKTRKELYFIFVPLSLICTGMFIHLAISETYTRGTCIYIEKTLDILAPKISEDQRLVLRAMYRNVDNANKFYELNNQFKLLAETNKIKLPQFSVIK